MKISASGKIEELVLNVLIQKRVPGALNENIKLQNMMY